MIVIVDERETVLTGYTAWFSREGVSATGLAPHDFRHWVNTAPEPDIDAVEAFLLGDFSEREMVPGKIKSRSAAAVGWTRCDQWWQRALADRAGRRPAQSMEPRAGRGLCCARAGREGHHRDAQ